MAQQAAGNRLATILWFVAAALAFIAFGIRISADGERNWSVGAMGIFCLVMGIASRSRSRGQSPPPG